MKLTLDIDTEGFDLWNWLMPYPPTPEEVLMSFKVVIVFLVIFLLTYPRGSGDGLVSNKGAD